LERARQNSCHSVDQPIQSIDIADRIVETRYRNDCFKKFEDVREVRASMSIAM